MESQPMFEILGLKVPHSAVFASISSIIVFSFGFLVNVYWKIKNQINHLIAFKSTFNLPNAKLHIEPFIDYDFEGHKKELYDLVYSRKILTTRAKAQLYYSLDLHLRACEKTWESLVEMYELLSKTRGDDFQRFSSAELNFKMSLFELDHKNQPPSKNLTAFFAYQRSLSKEGTYNAKFINYYSKIKDYCFANGDPLYGDLLKKYFEVEYARFYLNSFDSQFLNKIDNRINELTVINEMLSSARLELNNSKTKWPFIP